MTYQELAQKSVLTYGDIARILGVSRQAIAQKALKEVPPNEAAIVAAEMNRTADMLNGDDAPKTVKEYRSMYRPIWRDGAYVWEDIDGNVYNPPKEEGPQWLETALNKVEAYLKSFADTLNADEIKREWTEPGEEEWCIPVRLHMDTDNAWYSAFDPCHDTDWGRYTGIAYIVEDTDYREAAREIITDLEDMYFQAIDDSPTEDGFRQLLTNL